MTTNKKKYISTGIFIFVSLLCIQAQVTIGSDAEPVQGALLQLKENENTGANSTKGLAMPRVNLTVTDDLTDIISSPAAGYKEGHIGLVIYNINDLKYNFCHGLYVWDGDIWQPLFEQPPVPALPYGSVTDIDGNIYKTLEFGTAGIWMVENLCVLHNNTGGALSGQPNARINPALFNGSANSALSVGSWADINALPSIVYSENDEQISSPASAYVKKFGLMYTSAQHTNLCPVGWHIPSEDEWLTLIRYFVPGAGYGTNDNAQQYLQGGYTNYLSADGSLNIWEGFICNNTQMSGFNILPVGRIENTSSSNMARFFGFLTDFPTNGPKTIAFMNGGPGYNGIAYASNNTTWATPVRCKKD